MMTPLRFSAIALLLLASEAQAQFFDGPESVVYDASGGRYLISNVLTGDIVQISDAGDTTYFDRTLVRTLGMTIADDMLYVADRTGLVVFDLTIDQKLATVPIAGMVELNDVAADTSGYLYITDSSAGKIFRMRISDHSYTTIINHVNIPNGILFDARNNRILFCQFIANAPIKAIDLDDLSVTTVLSSHFANFDGLAIDGGGFIYVSCWGNNSVYRYDNAFSLPAELVSSGHNGPADIFYNQRDNILAVPNYYTDVVQFLPIAPTAVDEVPVEAGLAPVLSQNDPNPFGPATVIRYHLAATSRIRLGVYNVLGQEIRTLVDGVVPAGDQRVAWDGRDETGNRVSSGVYLYRLEAGSCRTVRKMLMVK
jgi:hypothetical protein